MKINQFSLLKSISEDENFHRKKGEHNVPGVYFWGFTLTEDGSLPTKEDELVIYYIGKDSRSVVRRMMEEVTQLIYGGFGTIIDKSWLLSHPFQAQIYNLQESDKKGTLHPTVLHKSDGLHKLYNFFHDKKIQDTITWMKERLIFTWIQVDDRSELDPLELEMHSYVTNNILGVKGRVNFPNNNKFDSIDWSNNQILKDWLLQVKRNTI